MKKRSCRRTREEKEIHDQAIRIRKMTDAQLINHLAQQKKENYDTGYRDGLLKGRESNKSLSIKSFLDEIGGIEGIGVVTIKKLRKAAEVYGYM